MIENIEYAEDMAKLNDKTRIKLKWHFPALDYAMCLQRKRWYGWATTSWIYPHILAGRSHEYAVHWLFWNESYNRKKQENPELKEGKRIIEKIYQ